MKKTLVLGALMSAFGLTMAQQVTTYSVYDTDHNGQIEDTDVTATVTQITNDVDATGTQQCVTAEDLKRLLGEINTKLAKQDRLEAWAPLIAAEIGAQTPEEYEIFKGHAYVDLGITDDSGNKILWATCNVGATSPEDYGSYFAWGETETKSTYSWSTYKYCKGSDKTQTKYCNKSNYGDNSFTDSKTVLDAEDDAATVNWGGSWRMPTSAEQDKLRTNCYWEWVDSYNKKSVNGYVVYKKKSSGSYSVESDTHIFLPAAGARYDKNFNGGELNYYWSSSLNESNPSAASCLYFDVYGDIESNSNDRYLGLSVRPVCTSPK